MKTGGMEPPTAASKPTKIEERCSGSTIIVSHRGVEEDPGKSESPDPRNVARTPAVGTGEDVVPSVIVGPDALHQATSGGPGTGESGEGPAQVDES